MISFCRYWLPLLLWMTVIFSASADTRSIEHTSRFLEPLLRWLNPNISPKSIERVRWVVRKTAHMTEFGVMAWLTWRALQKPKRSDERLWSWKIAAVALSIVVSCAVTDELHQTFVPNRTGSAKDVCFDTAGGVLGLAATWACYRRRKT
jgi:VanZ family protein